MLKTPCYFDDPGFKLKTRKLEEIANSIVKNHGLDIEIKEASSMDITGAMFNFFVRDEQDDRVILLQSTFEIPFLVKDEIIDAYYDHIYFNSRI
jgi:hypothetical protein